MAEDASIRRLRRLLGNQRFEDESTKGEAFRAADAAERARSNATDNEDKQETAAITTTQAVENRPFGTAEVTSSAGKQNHPKRYRAKVKGSPYSDTEYETDTEFDQEAGPELKFCPIFAVNKYPYKYLGSDKAFVERVADARFNGGKLFKRKWTIFYIKPPATISGNPIFFVPAKEVSALLQETSRLVGSTCGFPGGRLGAGFCIKFARNEPRPRYLGISRSREEFDEMVMHRVPAGHDDLNGPWSSSEHGDKRSFDIWQAKLEAAILASKQKKQRLKADKEKIRIATKQQWFRQLRRSQRYLGLRAANDREAKGARTSIQEEAIELRSDNARDDVPELPPDTDATKAPQFAFDKDVVFISIDIEAHETMQRNITEIGLATLDTRHLKGVAPGNYAENWRSLIKYRHFRTKEFRHHTNSRFVHGCPDRFEKDFGVSEFIASDDVASITAASCKPPFPVDEADRASAAGQTFETRNVVIVGHNFDCDIDWLRRYGFEVLKLAGLIEILDTSMIHRAVIHELNPTTLGNVLNFCKIAGWNLHNAGNDAGYTLQAMLAMAVDHLVNPTHRHTQEELVERREAAMKLAAAREESDFAEWMELSGSLLPKASGSTAVAESDCSKDGFPYLSSMIIQGACIDKSKRKLHVTS